MSGIAQFMHVSPARYREDWEAAFPGESVPAFPGLPRRATAGSAGYDFFAPRGFRLEPGQSLRIPTGIRARMAEGWVLMLFPRSGLGFKYRLQLNNTVGIVDADYFGAQNEGHIFIKLTNAGDRPLCVAEGEAFAQGLFLPYGLTVDDEAVGRRVGGLGSTTRTRHTNDIQEGVFNMNTTLVVMAAGMASRYGGNKQITGMGPNNEILLEYSVYDAIRAGFNKVVFIIRPDMLEDMKRICGDKLSKKIRVEYAFQDYSSLPDWYTVPEGRTKPFGTVHAALCAADCVDEPFAIINADDYYGVDSFQKMHDFLVKDAAPGKAAMVGYRLKNTVSIHGAVTRGVCKVVDGRMVDVDEVAKIRLYEDGRIADTSSGEPGTDLDPNALVSMNFWGFHPDLFEDMRQYFEDFLKQADPGDIKAECLLPVMVDSLLKAGRITVDMLQTESVWFGVTYKEDRPLVQQSLLGLHADGVYPEKL